MRSLAFLGTTDPGDEFVPVKMEQGAPAMSLGMVGSILGTGGQRAHKDDARGPILYGEEAHSCGSGHCAEPKLGVGSPWTLIPTSPHRQEESTWFRVSS